MAGAVRLLDGGFATHAEAMGADVSSALWSAALLVDDPGMVRAVHAAYRGAGAQVVTTAGYQATVRGLVEGRGMGRDEARAVVERAVALARDEARGAEVAASMGCYGAALADGSEYHARGYAGVSRGTLKEFHAERTRILAATRPDYLAFETVPTRGEADAIAELLDEEPAPPGMRVWVSFACRNGRETNGGDAIEDAVRAVGSSPAVWGVGINCTAPEHITELIQRVVAATDKAVVVAPNSGESWDAVARRWVDSTRQSVAERVAEWTAALGGRQALLGGCCRVGPEEIRRIGRVLGIGDL